MQTITAFALTLTTCAAFFFFLPHHHRNPNSFKACTLWRVYRDVFQEAPALTDPRKQFFFLLVLIGIAAAYFPALLVLMLAALPRSAQTAGGAWFVIAGLLAVVGSAVNLLLILVSHMNFAFGGSSSTKDQTIGCWLIPLTELVVGLLSIGIGFSSTCAAFARKMLQF